MANENTSNPLEHTSNLKKEFADIIERLRGDVTKIDDPSAKPLFEVSAEVIIGRAKSLYRL